MGDKARRAGHLLLLVFVPEDSAVVILSASHLFDSRFQVSHFKGMDIMNFASEKKYGDRVSVKHEKRQFLPPKSPHSVSFTYGTKPRPPGLDLTTSYSHAQKS